MCVADSKPQDPPEKRAWAIYHNAETVAAQAREALAVAQHAYRLAYEESNPSGRAQAVATVVLDGARDVLVNAEDTVRVALRAFVELRDYLGLTGDDIQSWSKEHKGQVRANTDDHR